MQRKKGGALRGAKPCSKGKKMLASLLRFPIPAPALTDEAVAQFAGADGTFKGRPPPALPSSKKDAAHSLANQVHPHLRHTLGFRDRNPVWNARVFDVLGNATLERLSPPAYPHAAADIKYAIETVRHLPGFSTCGQRSLCLVVSSLTPWVETMLLQSQTCATVHVLDYNPPILEDGRFGDRLQTFAPSDAPLLDGADGGYDLVVSFSGIEHSGLTRYGDLPDPQGDVRAGAELAAKLKRNGCGFLGLPLAASTDVVWPQHRMYGPPRFREVTRAFGEPLGFVWGGRVLANPFDPATISNARSSVADWQYQPVAMLTISHGSKTKSGSDGPARHRFA
jgi:hypothetical protein